MRGHLQICVPLEVLEGSHVSDNYVMAKAKSAQGICGVKVSPVSARHWWSSPARVRAAETGNRG